MWRGRRLAAHALVTRRAALGEGFPTRPPPVVPQDSPPSPRRVKAKLWGDRSLPMPRRRPREVLLSLCPGVPRGQPPRRPGVDVALPEVDASVAPGDACLRRGVGEGGPGEREGGGGGRGSPPARSWNYLRGISPRRRTCPYR